jgi:metal-responsive CopG/Arc/MetJ family transcriptional regulator
MVQKQKGHKIVNFSMTDEDLERLDNIVQIEGYQNRADAIRTLIRLFSTPVVGKAIHKHEECIA